MNLAEKLSGERGEGAKECIGDGHAQDVNRREHKPPASRSSAARADEGDGDRNQRIDAGGEADQDAAEVYGQIGEKKGVLQIAGQTAYEIVYHPSSFFLISPGRVLSIKVRFPFVIMPWSVA